MNLKLALAVALALLSAEAAYGCRMFGGWISKADPNEYVFIGTVTGYEDVQLVSSGIHRFTKSDAAAVIVSVTESVHLPSTDVKSFEVVPMRYHADCSFSGSSREDVEKQFPVDSKVRVVARRAVYFLNSGKTSPPRLRLEAPPVTHTGIWLNTSRKGETLTAAESVFDYSKATTNYDDEPGAYSLPLFEVRKDLWRLERSRKQKSRNKILDRMIMYPRENPFFLNFRDLLKFHTSSESEYSTYLKKREEIVKLLVRP